MQSKAVAGKHHYLSVTNQGSAAIAYSSGNEYGFNVLRGGSKGTNFDPQSIKAAKEALKQKHMREVLMIDCSHGNSQKDYRNQPKVAQVVGDQILQGEEAVIGVMIESNIYEGSQRMSAKESMSLEKGVSITDGCIDWRTTVTVLTQLADAVETRRTKKKGHKMHG